MLAIYGCCKDLPGCGTAMCIVQDKHTQMFIFYSIFQKMPGNLASLKTVTTKTVKGNNLRKRHGKVYMLYYYTLRARSAIILDLYGIVP